VNIYIYNCPNTFNYGSMMMGENFISYFDKISKERNKYYVETDDEINIERLRYATGNSDIYFTPVNSLFKEGINKYDYIYSYYGIKDIFSDFIKQVDMVVVLGGDDFTEDYGWKGPIKNAIRFNLIKKTGLNLVMLGQTMGPYHSFRKPIMKNLLGKVDKIYLRDPITYKYLKNLGLKNITLTDDLALLPLSKQEIKEKTKEYITYCPSELIYRYSPEGKRESWINFNLFMINAIMDKYPDKKLILIAHVLKPEKVDDRKIVNELYQNVEARYKDRIMVEDRILYPYQVRDYIQQSLFTLSSRMHPVVSSIQCEVPAIALSYSNKYWGIIGERYGLKDYILDVRYLSYDQMKDKFMHLLSTLDHEYETIQKKMMNKNELARKSILSSLREISML